MNKYQLTKFRDILFKGLGDTLRGPLPGETDEDFIKRTSLPFPATPAEKRELEIDEFHGFGFITKAITYLISTSLGLVIGGIAYFQVIVKLQIFVLLAGPTMTMVGTYLALGLIEDAKKALRENAKQEKEDYVGFLGTRLTFSTIILQLLVLLVFAAMAAAGLSLTLLHFLDWGWWTLWLTIPIGGWLMTKFIWR